jgi:hypothetical protein
MSRTSAFHIDASRPGVLAPLLDWHVRRGGASEITRAGPFGPGDAAVGDG